MDQYICIHGHFYQPPRENPWLDEIELQDSAYPYHDWNERITAECYAQNTASRILEPKGRIIEIVNNYSKMSFNFGPTLLSWMERHNTEIYNAIIEADKISMERFSGHGSALAQVYNHMIMPLANRKDKNTQVIWGIQDFVKRFGRFPEGMWLPETAVDTDTLEILAEFGIKFTILSPRQAARVREINEQEKWCDVSGGKIDPTMPYRCILPSKRSIVIFFYDGNISHDVAFGELLNNGESFARRLISSFSEQRSWPQLVHIATDGETYGHHHRFADMALAYCLYFIETNNLAKITNYGEFLEKYPPTHVVEIFENSSWSCFHGIERWRENCGCNSGMHQGWSQEWRAPLREAMNWLRDKLELLYEKEGSQYLKDPWKARNDYIEVILDESRKSREKFLGTHTHEILSTEEKVRVLKLMEMQRNAMLMFTSCGWFFDEISGIETVQVLHYAARAVQLIQEVSETAVEHDYLSILEGAQSNLPGFSNGKRIYELFVKPAILDLTRVGAHYAISSLFEEYPTHTHIYCYTVNVDVYDITEAGKLRLALGKAQIASGMTWDTKTISFAVLHLGDHNFNGGIIDYIDNRIFASMSQEIKEAFGRGDVPEVIRLMDKHFGVNIYSLWHLFRDEQRKILDQVLQSTLDEIRVSFRQLYEGNYIIMNFMYEVCYPLPKPLLAATEFVLNADIKEIIEAEQLNFERLKYLIAELKRWGVSLEKPMLSFISNVKINSLMENLSENFEDLVLMEEIEKTLSLLRLLPLDLDLWKSQNIYCNIEQAHYNTKKEMAEKGREDAKKWLEIFHNLGHHLKIKVS